MSEKIIEHVLAYEKEQTLSLAVGTIILRVAYHDGIVRMWALADEEQEKVDRTFIMLLTGDTLPCLAIELEYVGTAFQLSPSYAAIHIFEKLSNNFAEIIKLLREG